MLHYLVSLQCQWLLLPSPQPTEASPNPSCLELIAQQQLPLLINASCDALRVHLDCASLSARNNWHAHLCDYTQY